HERALSLRRRALGADHELVGESLVDCSWSAYEQQHYADAERLSRQALGIYRKRGVKGKPLMNASWVLEKALDGQAKYEEAEALVQQALLLAQNSPGQESPEVASMLHGRAEVKNSQSQYVEAESLARGAVEMHRRLRGPEDIETAWALDALGEA